jgi:hypothetical protein
MSCTLILQLKVLQTRHNNPPAPDRVWSLFVEFKRLLAAGEAERYPALSYR